MRFSSWRSFANGLKYTAFTITTAGLLFGGSFGCGMIVDSDRIVVAELNGKSITLGDLYSIIHDMPDDKRPNIQSRQDYFRILNSYIDHEIKIPLGEEMAAAGTISIPREIAREAYFQSIQDEEKQKTQRYMWSIPVPEPGQETDLMQVYNITAQDVEFTKNAVDQGTDKILDQMLGDRAVAYLAGEAYNAGNLELNEETLRLEYEITKENYKTLEQMAFLGIQFPTDEVGASAEASKVRERIVAGEDFETIFNEYFAKDPNYCINSAIENNPNLERFRGFWLEASGSEVGDVRGPVYMPEYARMKTNASGEVVQANVPECFLVFKVTEHTPEAILSFEQALPQVAPPIAYAEMMKRLRDEHGVVIYEDKLENRASGKSTILE